MFIVLHNLGIILEWHGLGVLLERPHLKGAGVLNGQIPGELKWEGVGKVPDDVRGANTLRKRRLLVFCLHHRFGLEVDIHSELLDTWLHSICRVSSNVGQRKSTTGAHGVRCSGLPLGFQTLLRKHFVLLEIYRFLVFMDS